MKALGIVCEYNPFHNGHKYLIDEAKKITKCDFVVAIMSGNFIQQGNIALYDKFTRANLAIKNGIDLVIELPVLFSNSSAQYFSYSAIKILNDLGFIDNIAFGTECDNIKTLDNIAKKIIENEKMIWETTSSIMNDGISFADARAEALKNLLSDDELLEIKKPNNILAIEYIKSLIKLNSKIKPISIKRVGAQFDENNITCNNYCSATSIRNLLYDNKDISVLKNYVPSDTFDIIQKKSFFRNDDLFYILKYKILSLGTNRT